MSELVKKKANQGSQDLDLFKMPEAQPEKTIDLNLGLKNAEYRDKEQKTSPERQQAKNDFAFSTEGLSEELLRKLDLKVSKESREKEIRAEKEIDELRAQAVRSVIKPTVDTNQTQELKNKTTKEVVVASPREDLPASKIEPYTKKEIDLNKALENPQVIRTQTRAESVQVPAEQIKIEPITRKDLSHKQAEQDSNQVLRADSPAIQIAEPQKLDIPPNQAVVTQIKKSEEMPIRETIKDSLTSSTVIQPERVAKIIEKPEVKNALVESQVETVKIDKVIEQKPQDDYRPADNKTSVETKIEPVRTDTLQLKNDIQLKSEDTYRPVINQEQQIDAKITAEVSLPQVERKPIPEPQLHTDRIEEKSAPVLSADTFMKPVISRLEEQDLELLKDLAIKRNTNTSLEISSEKESEKGNSRKQLLDQEFIRLKPQGYVDTILDKLVSLLAGLLKKLEALFFGKSTKAKDIKSLKALRAAELEQFMVEKEKESRAQKIAKSSRARKNFTSEDEEDIS